MQNSFQFWLLGTLSLYVSEKMLWTPLNFQIYFPPTYKQHGPQFENLTLSLSTFCSFQPSHFPRGLRLCLRYAKELKPSEIPVHHPDVSKLHVAIFGIVYIKHPYNLLIFLPHLDVLASNHFMSGNSLGISYAALQRGFLC